LPLASAAPELIQRGEQLAKVGSAAKDLQACDNCHGPGGIGIPPAIPYLAGQYAQCTAFELKMWQRGYRRNSPEVMFMTATKLDDQDIAALAAYYQSKPVVTGTRRHSHFVSKHTRRHTSAGSTVAIARNLVGAGNAVSRMSSAGWKFQKRKRNPAVVAMLLRSR
jgi:cytochrome c553